LQYVDERFALVVHPFDGLHALVGFSTKEVHIAHQPKALQQEDLLLWVTFFGGQHQFAKLAGHHFGKFQSAFRHVPLDLQKRLGRVLHAKHGNINGENAAGYHAFAGTGPVVGVWL